MKSIASRLLLCFLSVALILGAAACSRENKDGKPHGESSKKPDISSLDPNEFISLGNYKGLSLVLEEGKSKFETVWAAVVADSRLIIYPEGLVEYYINQATSRYKYYAELNEITYEQVLADFGIETADILAEARALAKEDLVSMAIIKAEGITLSEEEKTTHFDRYAKKFVSEYGYDEDYVKENLSELVYESMLQDKMFEFLILNNEFISQGALE